MFNDAAQLLMSAARIEISDERGGHEWVVCYRSGESVENPRQLTDSTLLFAPHSYGFAARREGQEC
jgi:hypothetical protein